MPQISVSDSLYRKIEDATDGQDTEEAMADAAPLPAR